MNFLGTEAECAEWLAEVNAGRGYPRTFSQADIDSGGIVRHGGGRHVPLDLLAVTSAARVRSIEVDAEGEPTGVRRRVSIPGASQAERAGGAKWRLVRLLTRARRAKLVRIPGIGRTTADAIIAARVPGERLRLRDLQDVLPARALSALRDYRDALRAVDDDDDTDEDAPPVRQKRRR